MPKRPPSWSEREDKMLMKFKPYQSSWMALQERLPVHRTIGAMKQRRHQLLHPELYTRNLEDWSDDELKTLKREYPTAESTKCLVPMLPRRSVADITDKAYRLGLKRTPKRVTIPKGVYKGKDILHWEVVDQIRSRIKEDGYSYREFDRLLNTSAYWTYRYRTCSTVSLVEVAKAVSFFGGTIVIDWRDRV